jgi:hypothetical protein
MPGRVAGHAHLLDQGGIEFAYCLQSNHSCLFATKPFYRAVAAVRLFDHMRVTKPHDLILWS